MRNVLPDWAVRLLVGTLLLPALLAALDGWFRARRRRLPVGRWLAWLAAGAAPLVLAWAWLRVLGAHRRARRARRAGDAGRLSGRGAAGSPPGCRRPVLALVGWFGVRPLVLRRVAVTGSPAAGGLAAATGLLVTVLAAIVWVLNPYAAALLLPAAHLWLLAASPGSRLRGALAALAVAGGLLAPALIVAALRARARARPAGARLARRAGDRRRPRLAARRARLRAVARVPGRPGHRAAHAPARGGDRGARAAADARAPPATRARARWAARSRRCGDERAAPGPPAARPPQAGLRALSTVLIVGGRAAARRRRRDAAVAGAAVGAVRRARAGPAGGPARRDRARAARRRSTGARSGAWTPSRRLAFAARALRRRSEPRRSARAPADADRSGRRDVFVEGTGAGDLRKGPGPLPRHAAARRARARSRSRATGRPTARRSTTSTTWTRATGSSSRCRTGCFHYRVERTRIVAPTATWVTRRVDHDRLVLSACHPLYSAAQRIVVFARLVRAEAVAAAAGLADSGARPHRTIRVESDDGVPMTVLALRSPTRDQRRDALESTRSRFGRDRVSSQVPDSGTTKVEEIRARIERGTYTVDAGKVADAIVERLLAGRSVRETDAGSLNLGVLEAPPAALRPAGLPPSGRPVPLPPCARSRTAPRRRPPPPRPSGARAPRRPAARSPRRRSRRARRRRRPSAAATSATPSASGRLRASSTSPTPDSSASRIASEATPSETSSIALTPAAASARPSASRGHGRRYASTRSRGPSARPSSTARPAADAPSVPVTPTSWPGAAPSRPISSSARSAQPVTVTASVSAGPETRSPPAIVTPVRSASASAPACTREHVAPRSCPAG